MSFYTELKILSFQKIAFSQTLSSNLYQYELDNHGYGVYGQAPANGGVLEIGFVEQNPVILKNEEEEYIIEENCIFIIPPASHFLVSTFSEGQHRHSSVEFLIRGQWKKTEQFAPSKGRVVTLPMIIPPCPGSSDIFALIRGIISTRATQPQRSYFEECADFMMLIHRLSALVETYDPATLQSPGNRRYCERAKAYVSENIGRRITVGDIAAAVGISKNYLTNVFSSNEGLPLMEYINRRKLSYMLDLIRRYGYTLARAGEHVGFSDSNYISRIFKRYYGVTLTEYRRNDKFREENSEESFLWLDGTEKK